MFKENSISIIDKIIFGFILVFVASLTNSIFVNQIGYFLALIFILVKIYLTKKNSFEKNGLELAFLLLIVAEIISSILSIDHYNSFRNLFKRIILIPTLYVTVCSIDNLKKAKFIVYFFLITSLLTILVYVYFSIIYFLQSNYRADESGPDIFEHIITTSELFSFPFIILFAYLINEKTKLKFKFLLLIGFLISSFGLIATFKRTGWLGAFVGILIVLFFSRKWILTTIVIIAIVIFTFTLETKSFIQFVNYSNAELKVGTQINTKGYAYLTSVINDYTILADYNDGIKIYNKDRIQNSLKTEFPVTSTYKIDDSTFVAFTNETKLSFYNIKNDKVEFKNKFISPGNTIDFSSYKNTFGVLDTDSGLTLISDINNLKKYKRFTFDEEFDKIFLDSCYIFLYSNVSQSFNSYIYDSNFNITSSIKNKLNEKPIDIKYFDGKIYFLFNNRIEIGQLLNNKIVPIHILDLPKVRMLTKQDDNYFAVTLDKNLIYFKITQNGLKQISQTKLDYLPISIQASKEDVVLTYYKRNRILSIFDINHPTNISRFMMWKTGIKIFLDNKIFGIGDIGTDEYIKKYKEEYQKEIVGHLHNNYLHLLVILGIVGFAAALFLFYKMFQINLIILKKLINQPFMGSFALGTIGCYVSFLVAGLTEWNFGDHEIVSILYFVLGTNIALYKIYEKNKN